MLQWLKKIFCREETDEKDFLGYKIEMMQSAHNANLERIKELEEVLKQFEKPDIQRPTWLTDNFPYQPIVYMEGEHIQLTNPCDIYTVSATLEKIVREKGWKFLEHDQKLIEIWKYVIHALTYEYDENENWQFPILTIKRRRGDCEDGTILFVTLCKIAEIPADKVFNCVGNFGAVYHSFPIAQLDDGKWYIFESTLNNYPGRPKEFKGSEYDGTGGVCNWQFFGGIDNEEGQI